MHVRAFSKQNRLTLGPIAPQQHTPMWTHVHSGNGKLTLLSSLTSNIMQHKRLCMHGDSELENSPYFHTYGRAYMQYTPLCLHVDSGKGKLTLLPYLNWGEKKMKESSLSYTIKCTSSQSPTNRFRTQCSFARCI